MLDQQKIQVINEELSNWNVGDFSNAEKIFELLASQQVKPKHFPLYREYIDHWNDDRIPEKTLDEVTEDLKMLALHSSTIRSIIQNKKHIDVEDIADAIIQLISEYEGNGNSSVDFEEEIYGNQEWFEELVQFLKLNSLEEPAESSSPVTEEDPIEKAERHIQDIEVGDVVSLDSIREKIGVISKMESVIRGGRETKLLYMKIQGEKPSSVTLEWWYWHKLTLLKKRKDKTR